MSPFGTGAVHLLVRVARRLWKPILALLLGTGLVFGGLYSYDLLTLPPPDHAVPEEILFLDAADEVIERMTPSGGRTVPLQAIPEVTRQAFIAIEDERFYRHRGIDLRGTLRALWVNLGEGRIVQGGSTITQQLVKNIYLSPERTLARKIREASMALVVETRHTKDEILKHYLNQVYLGHGAWGVQQASEVYFGQDVEELDAAQSALLAGMAQAPYLYSPFVAPERSQQRMNTVLKRMADLGFLAPKEAEEIGDLGLPSTAGPRPPYRFPYFVTAVLERAASALEDLHLPQVFNGGLTIRTTLDPALQQAALQALEGGTLPETIQGALVALDPNTGDILALVGGQDFTRFQFNLALHALRPPASTFKPFTYAAALNEGYTVISTFRCEPVEFETADGTYRPTDYDGGYHHREMTLREALIVSDNVVAVRLNDKLGPQKSVTTASLAGIESPLEPTLSFPLGTMEVHLLELTRSYATLASGGQRSESRIIRQIEGPEGRVLYRRDPVVRQVLDARVTYILTDMLRDVIEHGTARRIADGIDFPAAGKTGTTDDLRDAWFVGYTPEIAAGVHLTAHDQRRPLASGGGGAAAPIWARFMDGIREHLELKDFTVPEGLVFRDICLATLAPATGDCPDVRTEVFIQGTEPPLPEPPSRPGKPPRGEGPDLSPAPARDTEPDPEPDRPQEERETERDPEDKPPPDAADDDHADDDPDDEQPGNTVPEPGEDPDGEEEPAIEDPNAPEVPEPQEPENGEQDAPVPPPPTTQPEEPDQQPEAPPQGPGVKEGEDPERPEQSGQFPGLPGEERDEPYTLSEEEPPQSSSTSRVPR